MRFLEVGDGGRVDGIGERLQRTAGVVVLAVAVVGLGWLGWRAVAEPPEAGPTEPGPVVTIPPVRTPAPTESASEASSDEPGDEASASPSATPSASEGEAEAGTVLFGGGPAVGPWQQLGTVAEITHPDAPATARYSYTQVWSDPDEENQSPELWDQIVREVTAQLVDLGEPVDRPAFGGAPGSEPFNSAGGMEDVYFEDERFTAHFSAVIEDTRGLGTVYFAYIVDFDGNIVSRRPPRIYREDVGDFRAVTARAIADIRSWAASEGLGACERC